MLTTQGSVAQLFLSCCLNQKGMWDCGGCRRGFENVKFWVSGHFLCSIWSSHGSEEVGQEEEIVSLPGRKAFTVF